MSRKTIAEHMVDIMNDCDYTIVWYGDITLIDECAKRSGMYERKGNTHPLSINNRVLSALDRSKYFEKGYIKHIGRPARSFLLKEMYRGGSF